MNLLNPVSSIMTKNLITVSRNDSMKDIENVFKQNKIHHLLVVDCDRLLGIISKSDYLLFKRGFNDYDTDKRLDLFRLKKWTAEKIMTTGIAVLSPNDRINVALEIFNENLFHAIPIVEQDKVVGIVTTYDIIYFLSKNIKAQLA